jgi:hypothetical protein
MKLDEPQHQLQIRIKIYSWKLAGAYLICGLIFFFADLKIQPFIQNVFSGFNISFPFLTKAAFTVGPYGWIFLMAAVGAIVVLKDLKFQTRFLNPLFTVLLVLWVGCMVFTLSYPFTLLFRGSGSIH